MRCWIKYFVLAVFLDFIYLEASNHMLYMKKLILGRLIYFAIIARTVFYENTLVSCLWVYKINVYVFVKKIFIYKTLLLLEFIFLWVVVWGRISFFLNKNHFPNYIYFIIHYFPFIKIYLFIFHSVPTLYRCIWTSYSPFSICMFTVE